MRKTARNVLSLLIVLTFVLNALPLGGVRTVQAAAPSVVISQVYGGGGNSGAPYAYDFVELFNPGTETVTLNGWSLQYGSNTGNIGTATNMITDLMNVTIEPGEYYLVQEATTNNATIGALLPTPDLIDATPINLAGANGKILLVNDTVGLNCSTISGCGSENTAKIIDIVGYGSATMYRGYAAAPALSNTTAAFRGGGGCTDTRQNSADFTAAAPAPRNSASPIHLCSVPISPSLSINDVTMSEGDTGTTAFNFTVSLNTPAGTGGVKFDIATADGTATTANNDYVTQSLASQTIPAGSATYTFTVVVNGDEIAESDETFTVNIANVVNATIADGSGEGKITDDDTDYCAQTFTPIYAIQGSGLTAAVPGTVITQGVVVGDFETNSGNPGFFIQDVNGDDNPATSDGIFVFTSTTDLVSVGQVVRVTGFARERFNQTTLNGSNDNEASVPAQNIIQCGSTGSVNPVDVIMPFTDTAFLERYEGMLVRFPQTLYVTDTYSLGRYGQVTVSSTNRLFQPTAQELPGTQAAVDLQAANTRNQIIVDDGNDKQNIDPIVFGRGGSPLHRDNTLRGGDTINNLVGVLNYSYSAYRVNPTNTLGGFYGFEPANERPTTAPSVDGTLKISALNTLNFFNTFTGCTLGIDGGTTDCRGANTAAEYNRQWMKTVQAIIKLDADVLGIIEIENDGYGAESAIADLVNKLNEATKPGTYAFIDADNETGQVNALGTDAIKVGIIYKPAKVTPVGNTAVLNTGAFGQYLIYEMVGDQIEYSQTEMTGRNRPSLAQAFEENSSGERVIVSVNHLKSKSSTCENNISPVGPDPDNGDGQGNCNLTRKAAAIELMTWLAADPTGTGETDILILGDLNSYTFEDPIMALTNGGYTNLIHDRLGEEAYSYSYGGQWGYLDHALASSSLNEKVQGVGHYHTNADEPTVFDYNVEFKSVQQHESLYAVNEFRASDHDATLVGLDLASIPVNTAPVAVDDTYETDEDEELIVAAPGVLANDTDNEGDTLTTTLDVLPKNGTIVMGNTGQFTYTPAENFHGVDTFTYTVSDGELTGTATVTIEIEAEDDDPVAADDTYETDEDTSLIVAAPGVLANDTDADGDTLSAQETASPQHGTLSMTPDGGFLYTPDWNFHGTDTFTYEVTDGERSDSGTVTITVKAVDDGYHVVFTKDKHFPQEGEPVTFTAHLVNFDTEQPDDFSDDTVFDWTFETGHTGSGEVAQHAFSDEGAYVVTLNVDDPVYGTFTVTSTVTVKNANPMIDIIAPITIGQRGWVEKAGTFTDPGQAEQFTATVDYGDGTGVQPLALGNGTFNLSHQYFTAGDFTITIVLYDGDGGEDTLTVTATVEGRQFIFVPIIHR